jgi:AmiR/NasT family two-component response regulator
LFASLTAAAMGWSREKETLQEALRSREIIGQAIGILMEHYTLMADRAFGFLVRTSQTGNIKLNRVAQGVIDDVLSRKA